MYQIVKQKYFSLKDPNIDPMSLMSQQNDTKIIAIQSPNDSEEIKYYIQIKRFLISVSKKLCFISKKNVSMFCIVKNRLNDFKEN